MGGSRGRGATNSNLQYVFPSKQNLFLHAKTALAQPRWCQWRIRKPMKNKRELMKPSCVCTTALWALMKRCQLHSRKAVQKHGNPLTGLRASAQASSIEESSETWQQAKCIHVLVLALGGGSGHCWCWCGGDLPTLSPQG